MKVNPFPIVSSFLLTQPEITAQKAKVQYDKAGYTPGSDPLVVIDTLGGSRTVRDRMDRWDVTINVYAPNHQKMTALVYPLREALLERLPGYRHSSGAYVADVVEVNAPRPFSDFTATEMRWLYSVALYVYA